MQAHIGVTAMSVAGRCKSVFSYWNYGYGLADNFMFVVVMRYHTASLYDPAGIGDMRGEGWEVTAFDF